MRHFGKLLVAALLITGSAAFAQGTTARSAADCPSVATTLANNWLAKMTADAYKRFPTNPTSRNLAITDARNAVPERRASRLQECLSAFSRGRTAPWTSN